MGTSGSSWTSLPIPCPTNSLTTPKLYLLATSDTAYPISPTLEPALITDNPLNKDSSVCFKNSSISGFTFPTGYVQAESPWYPL